MPLASLDLYRNPVVLLVHAIAMQAGLPIYIVGGALRDMALGSAFAKDLDFVVVDCFEAAVRAFADGVHGRIIPWDFGQTRVVFQHGPESVSVDFSRCGGAGIIENLRERDFTINAMALDVRSLQPDGAAAIIDPLGGRQDLGAKSIRACSPQIFDNDPLRALRAIRLAAELGFQIEPATRRLLQQKAGLICRACVSATTQTSQPLHNGRVPNPTLGDNPRSPAGWCVGLVCQQPPESPTPGFQPGISCLLPKVNPESGF